jgi:hypothetical protein
MSSTTTTQQAVKLEKQAEQEITELAREDGKSFPLRQYEMKAKLSVCSYSADTTDSNLRYSKSSSQFRHTSAQELNILLFICM